MNSSFWCYTDSLEEAARVIAAKTSHLGVRYKVELTETGTYNWEHEFHIETARKDLGKEDITVAQAKMYIKDKMFEEGLPNFGTKEEINDYMARNYPWVDMDPKKMKRDEMVELALAEITRE